MSFFSHEYFMKQALSEANEALEKDEIPIGAIVVINNKIIGKGHNLTETLGDVTAHAEMLAISSAANNLGAKYLKNCTLYVTLEPCPMCATASFWAQIACLVYGASDLKRGYQRFSPSLIHPKTKIISGILQNQSNLLLKEYFKNKRSPK